MIVFLRVLILINSCIVKFWFFMKVVVKGLEEIIVLLNFNVYLFVVIF